MSVYSKITKPIWSKQIDEFIEITLVFRNINFQQYQIFALKRFLFTNLGKIKANKIKRLLNPIPLNPNKNSSNPQKATIFDRYLLRLDVSVNSNQSKIKTKLQ